MSDKNALVIDEDFDFGFSLVDQDELEVVRETKHESAEWEQKAMTMYRMVQPLLANLSANPEKDYIYWPNRVEKIEQFKKKLSQVIQ
jgi:hypothetical protein